MASKPVVDAVEAYLAANWGLTVFYVNNVTSEPPADGSAWLVAQYPAGSESHVGIGAIGQRAFRETGVIRLVLSVPRGQGHAQGLAWCDQLRALFRAKVIGANVTCRMPSPATENNDNDDGNYYVLSIAIPYFYDLIA